VDVVGDEARGARVTAQRFFEWVWRANALILFAAGIAALVGGATLAAFIVRDRFREAPQEETREIAGASLEEWQAQLGYFTRVRGTQLLRASLSTDEEERAEPDLLVSGRSYAYYLADSTVNLLHVELASGAARWLFPGHGQRVIEVRDIPTISEVSETSPAPELAPVSATVFVFVDSDTNGDGKLWHDDSKRVAIAEPDGARFTPLLSDVERVHAIEEVDATRIAIFYTQAGSVRLANVDLPGFRVVTDAKLAPAQPAAP
jgi:hypothetical protein